MDPMTTTTQHIVGGTAPVTNPIAHLNHAYGYHQYCQEKYNMLCMKEQHNGESYNQVSLILIELLCFCWFIELQFANETCRIQLI